MVFELIAIIGGSGFIGSRLCRRLEKDNQDFIILDKVKSPFYPEKSVIMDIRDPESFVNYMDGIDVVINLAAEHRDDVSPKSLYDELNVQGAVNLVSLCSEKNISKILFTSSVAVYGFAPKGTDETGKINYFNDYGRTKWEAEEVYRKWLQENPGERSLTIIRPTVVFGERNRGNVYNLLKQIASGLFPMIGNGKNVKSMAYVENVGAFIRFSLDNPSGEHVYNYIDKPDFNMNDLVKHVRKSLGKKASTEIHWPYILGYTVGALFDLLAFITRRTFPVSRIRIKKFCSDTMFEASNIRKTSFNPPVPLEEGIRKTIMYEFMENHDKDEILFYSE